MKVFFSVKYLRGIPNIILLLPSLSYIKFNIFYSYFFSVFWRTTIKNPVSLPFHSEAIPPPPKETPSGSCGCTQTPSTLCGHMRCTPSTRSFGTQTEPMKKDASAASTSTKAAKPAGVNILTIEKNYSGKILEVSERFQAKVIFKK